MKKAIFFYISIFFVTSFFSQEDSVLYFLNSSKQDSIKATELIDLAYRLDSKEEINNAMQVLIKCSAFTNKKKLTKFYIKSEKLRAFLLVKTSKYDEAFLVTNKLLSYSIKNNSIIGKAYSNRLFAIIEMNKGHLDVSVKKYLETQNFWEATKDSSLIIEGLSDLAIAFFYQKDYRNAIKYWKKTTNYYISHRNIDYAINPLSNMSISYIELKEYGEAEKIFEFILPKAIEKNDVNILIDIYQNMSYLEHIKKNYDKAIYYTLNAIKSLDNTNELTRIGNLYCNLGELYREKKDFKRAKENLFIGLNFVRKTNNLLRISRAYHSISDFYADIKNFELALAYKDTFSLIHDSIFTINKQEQIVELEKRFDLQQKEKQIAALNKDKYIQASELKKQRYLNYFFIISSILVSILVFLIYRNYKIKKEREQNKLQLLLQNAELTALKSQMNPHFIFNALNSIQHNIVTNNTEDAYRFLSKFSKLIRNILDNSSEQLISLKREIETLTLYSDIESKRFDNSFHHKITIIDNGFSDEDIFIPPMLIQPFIENAIWHGLMPKTGNKHLMITFTIVSLDCVICEILDNGIGRERARQIAVDKSKKHKSRGLANIYDRVKILEKTHSLNITIDMFDELNEENLSNGTKVVVKFIKNTGKL